MLEKNLDIMRFYRNETHTKKPDTFNERERELRVCFGNPRKCNIDGTGLSGVYEYLR